jgi:predicted nucleic-acid-binding protein
MKAIDTNVLVRFLVNDDPVQGEQVRQLFAAAERQREAFFVPILVLLETIWVLESAYRIQRRDLIEALGDLLLMPVLQFEQRPAVQAMLATVMANSMDLPDALIAQSALKGGCERVLTFDKKAARSDGFELLAMTAR